MVDYATVTITETTFIQSVFGFYLETWERFILFPPVKMGLGLLFISGCFALAWYLVRG